MRLFLDHCVPRDVADGLRAAGHEVERALDARLDRADDDTIFAYARKSHQVLLTTDHDFCNIRRFPIRQARGVVILDLEAVSKTFLVTRVQGFFQKATAGQLRGRVVLLKPASVRIWPKR